MKISHTFTTEKKTIKMFAFTGLLLLYQLYGFFLQYVISSSYHFCLDITQLNAQLRCLES